jgi:hypothetical protein
LPETWNEKSIKLLMSVAPAPFVPISPNIEPVGTAKLTERSAA